MTGDRAARVPFGRTRLEVTQLGLGSGPLGDLCLRGRHEQARAATEAALRLGIRFFDTAPLYGSGLAERAVGEVLRQHERDSFVLGTKVGRLPPPVDAQQVSIASAPSASDLPPVFDFSYDGVMRCFEHSLERLQLDRIDVLYLHDPDEHYEAALRGACRALGELRAQGVVGAIGAGTMSAEVLLRLATDGDFDCLLVPGRYTLLDQSALTRLLPLCSRRGIAVVVGGAYNSGILCEPRPGATFDYVPAPPALTARAQRLQAVCLAHGVPLKAAALQFPAAHPTVVTVLNGAQSVAEVEENVAMFRHPVPDALWAQLREERLIDSAAPTPSERVLAV